MPIYALRRLLSPQGYAALELKEARAPAHSMALRRYQLLQVT